MRWPSGRTTISLETIFPTDDNNPLDVRGGFVESSELLPAGSYRPCPTSCAAGQVYSSQGILSSSRWVRFGPSWLPPTNAGSGRSAVPMLPSLNMTPSSQ